MSRYDKFFVYPGPLYNNYAKNIACSDVSINESYYSINNPKFRNLDNLRYVVKKKKDINSPILSWRIDNDGKYIQLYWVSIVGAGIPITRLENNKHIIIIRIKPRAIFRCIVRLMQLKKRTKYRINTKKNYLISGMFRLSCFAQIKHRILSYI